MDMCCIDGKLTRNYTGVGLKMLMESCIYYGGLVDGVPNGHGDGIYAADYYDHFSDERTIVYQMEVEDSYVVSGAFPIEDPTSSYRNWHATRVFVHGFGD